jgi:hypothetical protein
MFTKFSFPKFTLFCCLLLLMGNRSFAQKVKSYNAIITTNTDHRYKGFLQDVSDKGLTIDYYGESRFIASDSISSIKIKRSDGLKRYSIVGAGVGLAAAIPIYIDGNNQGKLSLLALPVVLVAGTMGGALIGTLINAATSVKRYKKINDGIPFKNIQPVLLRYSKASPTRTSLKEK